MKKLFKAILVFIWLLPLTVKSQSFPPGFNQVQVTNGISYPTVFDFAPDGRIFVGQQNGALRVIKNGVLLNTPALSLDVDMNGERGLIGIVVHPDFSNNKYVYLYYTPASGVKRNIISRFTFTGDVVNPASEIVILELDPLSSSSVHNSGCMRFSQDGKLFVSVGESNVSANAQNPDTYLGKILRINPDGSVPSDNPFASASTDQRKRVWAMGLRNPFTFDINKVTGQLFVNDVGHASYEEINDATLPGINFGWPYDQGFVQGTTFTNPVLAYAHVSATLTGCAITGGAFFTPTSTNYPNTYLGKYFFMDYCSNWIRYIDPNINNPVSSPFASALSPTSLYLRTGPDGNLYFLSRSTGALNKIVYSLNTNPVINTQPADLTLATTQNALFQVSVAGSPPFSYQWKKNGFPIIGATSSSFSVNSVTLNDAGKYSVIISNASGSVISSEADLVVIATKPPVGNIVSPVNGTLYKAGDVINFSGTGTDEEDGVLPASAFSWKVEFFHGTGTHQHVHDGPPIAEGVKNGSFVIPVNGENATNVFYKLKLTVKDSKGITNTNSVDILPRISTLSLASNPAGFRLLLDGEPRNTVFTFESVAGLERTLGVIPAQSLNGVNYKFDSWLHGGSTTQIINTPQANTTYTANFVEDSDLRDPDNPANSSAGINYSYYEGSWLMLPDFNALTPSETGVVSTINISPKNRDMNFAFRFTGYIDILKDGVYKFFTNSNDGSKLFIGDKMVLNNDGQHANVEMAGTIGLKKGKHAITVTYFQYNGASNLSVKYSTEGMAKMDVPASALFYLNEGSTNESPVVALTSPVSNQEFPPLSNHTITANATDVDGSISKVEFYQGVMKLGEDNTVPYEYVWNNVPSGNYILTAKAFDNANASTVSSTINIKVVDNTMLRDPENPVNTSSGINYNYYEGAWFMLPDFTTLTPIKAGIVENFNLSLKNRSTNFAFKFTGYIDILIDGVYTFYSTSNDGSKLFIGDELVLNNDGQHADIEKAGSIGLKKGKHAITVIYFQGAGTSNLSVKYSTGSLVKSEVPLSILFHLSSGTENNLPVVSLTSPVNNQEFLSLSNIAITANALDADGSIGKVEFYQGAAKLGEVNTAPYQYTWNNVPVGNYILTAKAFDNINASSVSSPVNINVVGQVNNCISQGNILREYWNGISGTLISNIPVYISPSGSEELTVFEGPQNWANNYGSRISGYFCAPQTGNYYFWIACNDAGELWLSTDSNPDNKVKIAYVSSYTNFREWTKLPSQKSAAIHLSAGEQYYISALQKEGVNSDHISVGVQFPDGSLERPILGSRLSPYRNEEFDILDEESIALKVANPENSNSNYTILVYPNPIERGIITLGIQGYSGKSKAGIRITDINGKEVYSSRANCDKTCARTLINIDERFMPGIYLIYVDIENKMYYQKLIIK